MAAPLIAGNDLDKMTPDMSAILLNKDVIAVDQDALGAQGQDIWVKPLQNGAIAVVMLNRSAAEQTITLNWADLSVPPEKSFAVRDLWEHTDLGSMRGKSTPAPIPSHGTVMITLRP